MEADPAQVPLRLVQKLHELTGLSVGRLLSHAAPRPLVPLHERQTPKPLVALCGPPDAGKTTLINALTGAGLIASWSPTTAVPVFIKHARHRPSWLRTTAALFRKPLLDETGWNHRQQNNWAYCRKWLLSTGEPGDLLALTTRAGLQDGGGSEEPGAAVIYVDSPILTACDLLDLPGIGSGDREDDDRLARWGGAQADLMLFVSPANGFLRQEDLTFLADGLGTGRIRPEGLLVVASQAHTVESGDPSALTTILDRGCERLGEVLSPTATGSLRKRFVTYSLGWSDLRAPFEEAFPSVLAQIPSPALSPAEALEVSLERTGSAAIWQGSAPVTGLGVSPDGERIAWATAERTVILREMEGARLSRLGPYTENLLALTFAPDRQTLAVAGGSGEILLLHGASQERVTVLSGHTFQVAAATFSPDGRWLASGAWDSTVRLWDARDRYRARVMHGHTNWVRCVSFSPDSRRLASGAWDGTIRVWETLIGRQTMKIDTYARSVPAVRFSGDGQRLIAAVDNEIKIWDLATGRLVQRLQGHRGAVTTLDLCSNGLLLASGSEDASIRLWNLGDGGGSHLLTGHSGRIGAVAFCPGTDHLVSGSDDGSVRIWGLPQPGA